MNILLTEEETSVLAPPILNDPTRKEHEGWYLRPTLFFTQEEADSIDWEKVFEEW